MKNLITSFIVCTMVFTCSTLLIAQTKEEQHAQLTDYHAKAEEHASKSVEDGTSTQKMHKTNAEEATKNLELAKTRHKDLKKSMPDKYKSVAKPHHDAIDKYHAEAIKHGDAMKAEASKSAYNEIKVKEHAKNMRESIAMSEKEHQALRSETSK